MKVKWIVAAVLLLWIYVVLAPPAHAVQGSFFLGSGGPTEDKPQSKLWFNDGTWWAILSDGAGVSFYKLNAGVFVKQTFADAKVDTSNSARADVLWNGTNLFVLMYRNSTAKLSKYTYNAQTQAYTRLSGFPVSLPLTSGAETATLAQDSTGKLWVVYDPGSQIRVLWSTNTEHTAWEPTGLVVYEPVDIDDIAAVVAFNNRIGVMWSNQVLDNFGFRAHIDGQPATTWGAVEVISQGDHLADDHIHLTVTPAQDILAAVKTSHGNEIDLFIRWHDSGWDGPYFISDNATRPLVLFDQSNEDVYTFYTGNFVGSTPTPIVYKKAKLSNLIDLAVNESATFLTASVDLNDVTSTKQTVNATSGIVAVAKGGDTAYYNFLPINGSTNRAPVVNAGPDQTITLPNGATLNGSATDDGVPNPPGTLTRTWSKVSGPGTVSFANPAAASTTATFSVAGSYTLRLSANDGALQASDSVIVTVQSANQPPIVNAGSDQTITLPNVATLRGSVTDDGLPAGSTPTQAWSKVSGPGTVSFSTPTATSTTASFSVAGSYVLRLTATDGALSASDNVAITVNPAPTANQPPMVNAGSDQTIVLSASATLTGTVSDDGLPTGSTVSQTWSQVSGPGTVGFANPTAVNTMATFSATGSYVLRLTASDGELLASDNVTVAVADGSSTTVVETRVAAKTDDAEEKSDGSPDLTSGNVDLGTKPSGMRFLLAVPHGAHIVRAYVQFTVDNPQTGSTALTIEGEASDNALTFGSSKYNIVNRPRTANYVSWTPAGWPTKGVAGAAQQTPDLSTILQEIVDRPGWTSGQGAVLIVTGTGVRQAVSYDSKSATAPLLHVEYVP